MSDLEVSDDTNDTTLPESVRLATTFLKLTQSAWGKQRKREQEDLRFQIPDPEHQWEDSMRQSRLPQIVDGVNIPPRPMLCVSTLDEPIQLELNQERSAHLGITIQPLTEDASDETAEVLQGLYRQIERTSRAHLARSWAYDRFVRTGAGIYRVTTEYDPDGQPGDQRVMIKRMLHQDAARVDPFAQEPDFSDATQGMFLEWMPRQKFKKRFGASKLAKASDSDWASYVSDPQFENWFTKAGDADAAEGTATVLVAEYYWLTNTEDETEVEDWKSGIPKTVTQTTPVLHRAVVTATEELEPDEVRPGRYIPSVPMVRELQPVDGERYFMGMIRPAADGARLTNFGASQAVTMAAYEPLAPWKMAEGQDEGYEKLWAKSNTLPVPVLKYKQRDLEGNPAGSPERVQVDASRLGPSLMLLDRGKEFVQSATAKFGPALGQQTPAHRSGRAIEALQGQSVEATSNYLDTLAQVAMPHEACIVLDLIPHYYDRPGRVATILDENLKASQVMLNAPFVMENGRPKALPYGTPDEKAIADQQVADPNHPAKYFNLNKGRYGVSVTVGKAKASRLQAGADAIGAIIEADPQILPLIGPEWMHFQDFPGKESLEKILRKNRDHQFPWLSDSPDAQMPQQLQQAQQQVQMLTKQMQQMQADADKNRATLAGKQIDAQTKLQTTAMQERAESERAAADREVKLAVAELGAKVDRMVLFMEERERLGVQAHEREQAALDRGHESGMAAQTHAQNLEASDVDHSEELNAAAQQSALTPPEPEPEAAGA